METKMPRSAEAWQNLEVYGKRYRGRPKPRWHDTLHLDLNIADVHSDEALIRENWRHYPRKAYRATFLQLLWLHKMAQQLSLIIEYFEVDLKSGQYVIFRLAIFLLRRSAKFHDKGLAKKFSAWPEVLVSSIRSWNRMYDSYVNFKIQHKLDNFGIIYEP